MQQRTIAGVSSYWWFTVAESIGKRTLINSPDLVRCRIRSGEAGLRSVTGGARLSAVYRQAVIEKKFFTEGFESR